ncbi:MAG: hypothetical protein ABI629_06860, partial [bacterium]
RVLASRISPPASRSSRPIASHAFVVCTKPRLSGQRRATYSDCEAEWQRLAALGKARNARVLLVAEPQTPAGLPQDTAFARQVLTCAEADDLLTLDLTATFERLPIAEREKLFMTEGKGHMNSDGNRLVATEVARLLRRDQ